MLLIAGLGNPGSKYCMNRHNIGFMALDSLADSYMDNNWRKKFQGQIVEGKIEGETVLMIKPQTFMNNSGNSIGEVVKFYKIPSDQVIVFHDEIDLAPGKVRIKSGGGHAGHNGLRSIISHIGPDFLRIRMGIGHPGSKDLVHNYVLGNFSKQDQNGWLVDLLTGVANGFPYLVDGNHAQFLNKINLELQTRPKTANVPKRSDASSADKAKKTDGIFSRLSKFFG
ncbi:MAG: aminoacyl-tRNA hydrolase [Rhodobacteraceae bacterium]|nr:aminoacyl-tRNA hydrolase [Paracoccaceae bacterium]MYF45404.1 aminoacyl-tRNA hydrolase [Paracoccaceae bacterium]MYI90870.1 aminoacyl-tRNA hydrolase [Paracoccaceae bacterium]